MPYEHYYSTQKGEGLADIGAIYRGPPFVQHGHGVGSIFSGLIRYMKPLFFSGMSALKDQSLKTGQAIIRDLGNRPFENIL
jgi:hypothetical protein